MTDFVEVTEDNAPKLVGWFALSPRGLKALTDADIARETDSKLQISRLSTQLKIADVRNDELTKALEAASWCNRYCPVIAGTAVGVALIGGGILGFELGRGARYYKQPAPRWHVYRPMLRSYGH